MPNKRILIDSGYSSNFENMDVSNFVNHQKFSYHLDILPARCTLKQARLYQTNIEASAEAYKEEPRMVQYLVVDDKILSYIRLSGIIEFCDVTKAFLINEFGESFDDELLEYDYITVDPIDHYEIVDVYKYLVNERALR